MILRARHLVFAWLTYGALQLALLGVPAASSQLAVGSSEGRTQSTAQAAAIAKRLLAPDVGAHRTLTPFAPSASIAFGLPDAATELAVATSRRQPATHAPAALPPARAPPATSLPPVFTAFTA